MCVCVYGQVQRRLLWGPSDSGLGCWRSLDNVVKGWAGVVVSQQSRQVPASSLLSSLCLSDLCLCNDVVRIKLGCFNAVTATFTRHISS